MNFFYKRTETEDAIEIVFKRHYLWYLNIIALFAFSLAQTEGTLLNFLVFFLLFFGFLYQFFLKMRISAEIGRAMKKGPIEVRGHKFSKKNPLTYTIRK